jgi:hypothetical protein
MALQRDNRRFQFGLRSLFWFTTVVAVFCSLYAWASRVWPDSGGDAWLIIVILLWPSFAALIVSTCPDLSFVNRVRAYTAIAASVVFVTISSGLWTVGLSVDSVKTLLVFTFVTACLVWVPQGIVVFGVTTYVLERRRRKQADAPAARESLASHDEANDEPAA